MNRKILKAILCCLISLILLTNLFPVYAEQNTKTAYTPQSFIDGIIEYKLTSSGASTIEQWIDGEITKNADSTEWYAIALSQYGNFDFNAYGNALLKYLSDNKVASASSRQKFALALIASGSTDSYIYNTLNDSIGKQGVMSWIFGLHLLNNGYTSNEYSLSAVKQRLLSLQKSDGGWAVIGSYSEIDASAMAIQALAPYYNSDADVKSAIDKALTFLSNRQNSGGDYSSYGVANSESTSQVIVALSSLGIDCETDSRFIKNGNTLFNGIRLYRLSDGSFCHKQGSNSNETATVQVLYSMISYLRMQNGRSPFFLLDARNPEGLKIPNNEETSKPTNTIQNADKVASSDNSDTQPSPKPTSNSAESHTSSEPTKDYPLEPDSDTVSGEQNTNNNSTVNDTSNNSAKKEFKKSSYKLWVSLAIIIVAAAICLLQYFLKKKNIKNLIVIIVITFIAIAFVLFTDFSTKNEYYSNTSSKENAIGTVTISIKCDTIPDKSAEHIPDDGVILNDTELQIKNGDTVYDILLEATAKNKIHLETSGSTQTPYIEGISNIYEYDFGDLSGWMYYVNRISPSVSCGEYKLSAGDKIEFLYTCDMGKGAE